MKVTSVELHPDGSTDIAVLSFKDPRRNGWFNVKNISGLDADEIRPRSYGGSGQFKELSMPKRDIVVRVELNPQYGDAPMSYADLRDILYRMISSSRTGVIDIRFMNDESQVAHILGTIVKAEASHFTETPEVQLTFECDYPLLRSPESINDAAGQDTALTILNDASTAWHGVKFQVSVVTARPRLEIRAPDLSWTFGVAPDGGFLVGDIISISSEHNDKYVYYDRGATRVYLADKIETGSIWPIMFPGENQFQTNFPASFQWEEILYYETYWGV